MPNKPTSQFTAIATLDSADRIVAYEASESDLRTVTGTVLLAYLGASLDLSTIASGGALPVARGGTGITSLGTGVATFLGTPSSANLLAAITDETGTGALVFANSPMLTTPVLGVASATSLACPTFTTEAGAMGFTPAAGSNFNITLSGAGDFTVNTNQLYVDTSAGNVGIGTTNPSALLSVGSSSQFQVNSTGAITAATGITSSGTITLSGFTTNGGLLYTNGSGVVAQSGAGTSTQILHGGTTPTYGAVVLTTDVSGTLPIANGGTGATSLASGYVPYSSGGTAYAASPLYTNGTNVGIGTTAPIAPLHINKTTAGQNDALWLSGGGGAVSDGATIVFSTSYASYPTWRMAEIRSTYRNVANYESDLTFRTNTGGSATTSTEKVRIQGDGNVGIGTTSPSFKLEVVGSAKADMLAIGTTQQGQLTYGGGVADTFNVIGIASKNLSFGSNGVYDRIFLDTSGNVGIGTTSPTALMHLGESTTARASLCIPSGTAPTSPVNGDIWSDGSNLLVRLGGTTYTLTKS